MKPYLSIIIPYHNSQKTIGRLLESIHSSTGTPAFEVIIVDDGSDEKFSIFKFQFSKKVNKKNIKVVRLERNRGPAAARNKGAGVAKGKFLVFLDSDVELFDDALSNITKTYKNDPDIVALTGVWVKEQKTDKFFPNYKALRDWSYWINERDKSGYYFLFSTRIASIKKTVFARLKGFDESYNAALVEDIELTYRIARRYAIIFASNVRVKHEFEDFWPIAKKYYLRSYHWSKLYAKRKKFDPVATTLQEAITAISGVGVVGLGIMAILVLPYSITNFQFSIFNFQIMLSQFYYFHLSLFIILLTFHIFLIRKFLVFMAHEKGFWFSFKGFFTGLILYCFIAAGALRAKLNL
ncbi:glycosyltransferase family 2 protein [Patescibacteria group bacterium]